MKINIPLLILIILTLSFSSCAKKDDSTAAATASDPAAITGETMTIGSIDYTSSLLSSCYDGQTTSTAGDSVHAKEQIFLYDNKTYIENLYFFSNSSCTTSLSSFVYSSTTYTSPVANSYDNASFVSVSASQNNTGKVYDNSSNELDNSTYVLLIFNSASNNCSGDLIGVKSVYPKSTTELQMGSSTNCFNSRTFNITDNMTMNRVYTPQ
jgi:type IV pilus biogenesis protein CpaD/CtpE